MRTLIAIATLIFFALSYNANADVSASLSYTDYPVVTDSSRSLKADLNAASSIRTGGGIFHAHTAWHISWHFHWFEEPDGSCKITTVTTQLTASIILPRLTSVDSAKSKRFSRYLAALRTHELGHYAIAQAAANEIDRRILAMPSMTSCRLLETIANELGQATLSNYRDQEKHYDETTHYGRSQGAWLEQ